MKGPALIVVLGVTRRVPSSLKRLDRQSNGAILRALSAGEFSGKAGEVFVIHPSRGTRRILLSGLGKKDEVSLSSLRNAAAAAARTATGQGGGVGRLSIYVCDKYRGDVDPSELARVLAEGAGQGAWRFEDYKTDDSDTAELVLLSIIANSGDKTAMQAGAAVGDATVAGQNLARELQALPGNVCTPAFLGDRAATLGEEHGFKVTVLDEGRLKRAGMNAILAVSRGSEQEARLIVIEYKGAKKGAPICLVGKGVTFDTGGISLKPALNMEEMKYDMSGAAAVLGAFEAIGRLKPECNVVGIIPSVENMPSGSATRPGDIVKSHLGKTIEIANTDAEGRLILCDALSYARRFKPSCVLDAATLTGAVVIGLGNHATGLLGNDQDLVDEVLESGELSGERCWQLPLWEEYKTQIKSDFADIKNIGGRAAGAITAASFLSEFTEEYSWAHLDIAGTAHIEDDAPHIGKGPAGTGARLFTQFVLRRSVG